MTGFDETVPPEPDPAADETSVDSTEDEDTPAPMGGDDDIAAGHLDEQP